ncbi:ABC-2 type transport system ATP-binding protein [Ruminiclostridium sufflavum DSM 19573]|uniref:ABC-2 type transport system ATP-binding protein n=1 Tax=Ruminiclostridium sufflavum DSM 19573 TaxID=1121337 RepID=A0A318XLH6_9FIRM|nr:ABC transporter ATP-binding protein [Ruminiclostridium sufflavum]PYG87248.1 ABC-2 type transport system ATP-binding protein [Ruminiclostridium sufflavum DSM 19573]
MSYIELKNITKTFGNTVALDNLSLELEQNKIYGLLGRNGAGKTTLLNLITNKLFPTEGEILIDGDSVIENDRPLSKVYFMTEKNFYPDTMTIKSAFKWGREFYPDFDEDYAVRLSEKFSLKIEKKIKSLSTGYKSIFKIVMALSCNTPVILLDEPVLGLDANHRDLFYKELLQSYSEKPRTIIISTHLIEEAADIIEDVIVIKNGRIIMKDSVENVLSQGCCVSGSAAAVDKFTAGKNILGYDALGGLKTAYLLEEIETQAVPEGLEVSKLDLQKLFIYMTNS